MLAAMRRERCRESIVSRRKCRHPENYVQPENVDEKQIAGSKRKLKK